MKPLLLLIFLASSVLAMTPNERALVQGLTKAQKEMRDTIAMQDETIAADKIALAESFAKQSSLTTELLAWKGKADQMKVDLLAANTQVQQVGLERDNAEVARDSYHQQLNAANLTISDRDAHIHKLKFIIAGSLALLAAFAVGLLIFHFAAPALNTIPGCILAFGVPAATFVAVFGFVWWRV